MSLLNVFCDHFQWEIYYWKVANVWCETSAITTLWAKNAENIEFFSHIWCLHKLKVVGRSCNRSHQGWEGSVCSPADSFIADNSCLWTENFPTLHADETSRVYITQDTFPSSIYSKDNWKWIFPFSRTMNEVEVK